MISRSRRKIHPYRAAFWSLLALAGVAALLQKHPLTLEAGDPRLPGTSLQIEARTDVLVLLSDAAIASAVESGEFERSYAWVDVLRQEMGPVSVAQIEELSDETLQLYRTLIVTSSAARDADAWTDRFASFAESGGTLALELPRGELRRRFAADGGGGWRRPNAITAADAGDGPTQSALRDVPLVTRFRGSTQPLSGAETLLAFDGAPVVYAKQVGQGDVIVFDFDVGAQLSRLQQGIPGADGAVSARRVGEPIRTFDLAATPALVGATTPAADLFERYLVHGILGHRAPVFALWPYPGAGQGALVTSHDARSVHGRPLWMSIHERDSGARSTTFVAAPTTDGDDAPLIDDAEFAGHGALLWVLRPHDAGLYRSYGFAGFAPVRQVLSLVGQLEHLEAALGDQADIRGARIWDGRWTREFTHPYRAMDAAELRYSVSYGAAPGTPQGMLFGTCQPFTPLDTNGLPFHVREIPVCFHDPRTDEDIERFEQALESAASEAWAVHLLSSADRFRREPNLAAFDVWRDAMRAAERMDMWIGGAGELLSFWRRREASALRVIASEVTSRTRDGEARTLEFTVEVETSARDMTLLIPSSVGELRFESATREGQATNIAGLENQVDTQTRTWFGREAELLPLNPGFTTVRVRFSR